MVNLRCAKCSAEIVPGTSFCRSCGAPVESQPEPSEMQTAVLDEKVARTTTQRFDARTTSEANDAVAAVRTYHPVAPAVSPTPAPKARTGSRGGLVIVVLILVGLLAGGGLVGVLKRARHSGVQTQVSQQFSYPGARTLVNVGGESGGVLQMETTDRIDKVSGWYAATLKPTKTLQLTAATVIMKNDKVTVTLAATGEGTTIVIKQLAP